jgi:hypothetical protein
MIVSDSTTCQSVTDTEQEVAQRLLNMGGGGGGGRGGPPGGRGGRGGGRGGSQMQGGGGLGELNPNQIRQLMKMLRLAKFTVTHR